MSIIRKLGAIVGAAALGTALLAAATPAQAAPTAAAAPAVSTTTSTTSDIVPGTLRIDRRCMAAGRILCANKTTRKIVYMLNGKVLRVADARFGCSSTPTREGTFKVYYKSRYHVSSLYKTPMPWAMFFSGGQAVHYSADFAARGYNGCSHGCVNMRSKDAISWMYARIWIGDKVIVYRS